MLTLEELHAHYKAVRARLSCAPPPPPKVLVSRPEPVPEPEPVAEESSAIIVPFPAQPFQTRASVLIQSIAHKHGVAVKDVLGPSRKHEHVLARQEAAYQLRVQRNFSLTKIGQLLGNRDHTTILHSVRKHEERLAKLSSDEPRE